MKYAHRFAISLLALAGLVLNQPVMADPPPGKGNPNKSNQGNSQGTTDLSVGLALAGISALTARNLALNVGSVGYAPLPPGIAKNLARGKPLPPGIAKKAVPASMLGQLPYHPGYEWQIAGSDLILIGIGTAIVADVLRNVFQ